ncbi:hypothetical protein DOY81_012436 [Sarcophaga bullata]|nr:hypothetical protein DOY81_012436 [Sarcophaga bullata]
MAVESNHSLGKVASQQIGTGQHFSLKILDFLYDLPRRKRWMFFCYKMVKNEVCIKRKENVKKLNSWGMFSKGNL